jgi:hypothetical protein
VRRGGRGAAPSGHGRGLSAGEARVERDWVRSRLQAGPGEERERAKVARSLLLRERPRPLPASPGPGSAARLWVESPRRRLSARRILLPLHWCKELQQDWTR